MVSAIVVAAWIFYDDALLLIHHKKTGRWLPVGGHVHQGEQLIDALRREVQEEVNLSIELLSPPSLVADTGFVEELPLPFRLASYAGKAGSELTIDFVARTDDITHLIIQESEVLDYQWLTCDELQRSRFVSDRVKLLGKRAFEYVEEVMNYGKEKV